MSALKNKGHSDTTKTSPLKFSHTIEFFPEEGKYHYDGHRLCNVSMSPEETKKAKGICPVCRKPMTIGVMYRVEELADRPVGGKPEQVIPYKNLIPLEEIIADALGMGKISKATRAEYAKLISAFGSEFNVLLDARIEEIAKHSAPIAEGVKKRTREQKAKVIPGFDGEYGKIKIFDENEREKFKEEKKERHKLF